MSKKTATVRFDATITFTIEESALDMIVSDPDRGKFKSHEEVAGHLAYNFLRNHASLSQLDGFADLEDKIVQNLRESWDHVDTEFIVEKSKKRHR